MAQLGTCPKITGTDTIAPCVTGFPRVNGLAKALPSGFRVLALSMTETLYLCLALTMNALKGH